MAVADLVSMLSILIDSRKADHGIRSSRRLLPSAKCEVVYCGQHYCLLVMMIVPYWTEGLFIMPLTASIQHMANIQGTVRCIQVPAFYSRQLRRAKTIFLLFLSLWCRHWKQSSLVELKEKFNDNIDFLEIVFLVVKIGTIVPHVS